MRSPESWALQKQCGHLLCKSIVCSGHPAGNPSHYCSDVISLREHQEVLQGMDLCASIHVLCGYSITV